MDFPIREETVLPIHDSTGVLWAIVSLVYLVTVFVNFWAN